MRSPPEVKKAKTSAKEVDEAEIKKIINQNIHRVSMNLQSQFDEIKAQAAAPELRQVHKDELGAGEAAAQGTQGPQ